MKRIEIKNEKIIILIIKRLCCLIGWILIWPSILISLVPMILLFGLDESGDLFGCAVNT